MKATLRLVNTHQKANKCLKAFSSVILCQDLLTEEWAHRISCAMEFWQQFTFKFLPFHDPHYKYISIQWIEENTIRFKFQAHMFL